MGKKPAAQETKKLRSVSAYDKSTPCGYCGAASRIIRTTERVCENGHHFRKKRF